MRVREWVCSPLKQHKPFGKRFGELRRQARRVTQCVVYVMTTGSEGCSKDGEEDRRGLVKECACKLLLCITTINAAAATAFRFALLPPEAIEKYVRRFGRDG